ncbi:MAG: MBOAT family protein [Clostridia bacterium]|nr:MBOAT family protein [Clostridia bacterium]
MLFNSIEFLIFLPIVFAIFWLCPNRWRWVPLLIASYYFYMYWNPKLVFLILFTTLVSYFCGIFAEKYKDRPTIKKLLVAITLTASLGVLLFFKYFNFLYDAFFDVVTMLGAGEPSGYFSIMLPVGISFYTFQTASYVIDVYKGTVPAEKHLGYFALFVVFFPQLVAGPIERPGDLLPQLRADKSIKKVDYVGAFRFMMVGFFKKIAVADAIGVIVNSTYEDLSSATGLSALVATLLFAVQIYCDFSGYSDIAVASAKLFGVNLTENFRTPYVARSIKEFWNRWHLSLSTWLRDYIYFPLGGSRVGRSRWVFNTFTVFFISGLWHGASYNFVIWGLLHAFYQVVGKFTLPARDKAWKRLGKDSDSKIVSLSRLIWTFILVNFAWIFFRAGTLTDAALVIKKVFSDYAFTSDYFTRTAENLSLTLPLALYVIFAILLLSVMEKLKYPKCETEIKYKNTTSALRFSAYVVMMWCIVIVWIALQAADVGSSFIYFQF